MKRRILIAENDERIFEQIKSTIGSRHEVVLFSELCRFEDYIYSVDTVFIRMDDTYRNSFSLYKRIRREHSSVKLVWMSLNGQDALMAFEEQADAFLILPPDRDNITNVLKRIMY